MHDRLSAMLGLARAAGAGAEERAEEAVRVARIAEIYEDINNHKFPWLDVVCGVRALGNCAALAIFSRLSSSGTIGLTQTLPALLEPLLDAGSISLETTRSEEPTSELQSLMRISYAVFCLKKKQTQTVKHQSTSEKYTTQLTSIIRNSNTLN